MGSRTGLNVMENRKNLFAFPEFEPRNVPPLFWSLYRLSYLQTLNMSFLLTYLVTYLLHGAVLLEKLTGSQPVKKFPSFYETRIFITAFTSARHLFLSWASSIQSILPHPTSWKSSHLRLGLSSGLFPSGFPTKTPYTPLLSPIRTTWSAHLILLDFITRTIFGEQYRSLRSSICSFLHYPFTSSLLDPNTLLGTLFTNTQA